MKRLTLIALTGAAAVLTLSGCRKIEETPETSPATAASTEAAAPGNAAEEASGEAADTVSGSAVQEKTSEAAGESSSEVSSVGSGFIASADSLPSADEVMAQVNADGKDTPIATTTSSPKGSGKVIVYNWGEYIDPDVIDSFEEETGIKVVYEEFETNEIMYPKVSAGGVTYDVVCPSDYMVNKMIQNDLLQPIDYSSVPNIANIDPTYMKEAAQFDPGNKYCVPYCWGTVGILYNKTMVDDPVDSWNILWNEKYKDNILMQDSVRDALMVALMKDGYSSNTTNEKEVAQAADDLIAQKPLVQAYVIDQVRDKMIGGEAALGVIYSGEAIYTQRENPDLEYVIPKEGSNVWIDGWVIPKNAPNKENAEAFINYMCRADIALKNFEYITYSTPNRAARALIEDEDIKNSLVAFPTADMLKGSETYIYLGDDVDNMYTNYWNKVKSS